MNLNKMEENKKEEKCCEGGSCEKCKCCPMMSCCMGKKHNILKLFVFLVGLIIIFCFGVQLGELKEEAESCHSYRGGMMNWDNNGVKPMMYNFKIDGTNLTPTATPEADQ